MRVRIVAGAALACAGLAVSAGPASADPFGFLTPIKPYAKTSGLSPASPYVVTPLLSAGDIAPETSTPGTSYRFVGIPDGLGAYRLPGGRGKAGLYVNHELGTTTTLSEPVVGGPKNRGAFVSKYLLAADGSVLSGERAYDTVYRQNTLEGPAAQAGNATNGFARFCSGFLGGPWTGLDRPIYFTGEETGGAGTHDGRGGSAVAIYDNELHTLPKLGHFAHENAIVLPNTGRRTVIMGLEDGPATPDSQLYMYVGRKRRGAKTVLGRNGLDNGALYVFKGTSAATTEDTFTSGAIGGDWEEIPDAEYMSETELETAADAAGAFGFRRIEDGTAGKPGDFYFVTTGAGAAPASSNRLGRVYKLSLNPAHPAWGASLRIISNADDVIAGGGDTAISPDNVAFDGRSLMVQEDGTGNSRPVMAQKGRDGSIWRFDTQNGYARQRVVELNPPGRDGVPVVEAGETKGVWETSGIIDTGGLYGKDSWLFDVQAHPPTAAPGAADTTVEDGQLVLLTRKRHDGHR